jgi:integrase
MTRCPLHY